MEKQQFSTSVIEPEFIQEGQKNKNIEKVVFHIFE
jgi:hypothetical protein